MLGVSRTVPGGDQGPGRQGPGESRSKRGTVVLPRSEWRLLDPDVLAWLTEAGSTRSSCAACSRCARSSSPPGATRRGAGHARRAGRDPGGHSRRWPGAHDQATYLDADIRYHALLVAATHNDHLVQLVAAFGPALQTGLRVATRHGWEWPDFLEYSIGPHREVLEAVMAHDAERAGQAMERLVVQSQLSLDYHPGPDVAPSRPFTRA